MMAVDEKKLAQECRKRFGRADADKQRHRQRMDDCYRLALPWRRLSGKNQQDLENIDDIFDDTALTVVEDFSADMLNTFTPAKARWVDHEPPKTLDAGARNQIAKQLEGYAEVLWSEMSRSNLYQALQEAYLDLSVGTMALIIQDRHPSEPIHCQAIPMTELWIDRGPWGEVDGRFRRHRCRVGDILVMWPRANAAVVRGLGSNDREAEVTECLHRDWSDRGTEIWRYTLLVGEKVLLMDSFSGSGSCPIVVARWSRDSTTAWGIGPTYRTLPSLKTLNYVAEKGLKALDKAVDPVTVYDDDGIVNVSGGIRPGDWIPKGAGSVIEVVESNVRFDATWAEIEDKRSAVRRAHYQDRPQQDGKTPPTATQWADEAAERARRMGTPATNLVQELQYPIIARFMHLLGRRGVLPKVELDGKVVQLTPVSPLLRAQEQEEVVRAQRWAQGLQATIGPEQAAVVVDGLEMARWTAEKTGVPATLVRSKDEVQRMMEAAAQAQQQVQGGA